MWIQTRARRLRNIEGQIPKAVLVSRDVSEEFAAQAAMKEAKEAAEQSNVAKSEFMSRMSHELRTPLNSVLGFSQILQMELVSPDQLELVDHIFKSGSHLLGLINEVLDISRVESGHISVSLESVSVDDVVDECVRIMSPLANEAGIALVVHDLHDTQVLSDQQRLTQVLLNLMSNAVKFNSTHGTVTVDCSTLDDRVCLSVTDTGPGVPKAERERIFEPFVQAHGDTTRTDSAGLGLAIVRRLTEAHDGVVGLESPPQGGARFYFEAAFAAVKSTQRADPPLAGRSVVVVSPNPIVRAAAAGLIVGALGAAAVTLWLGENYGLAGFRHQLAHSPPGTQLHASLALGATSGLVFWPLAAAFVIAVSELAVRSRGWSHALARSRADSPRR